MTLRPQKDRDDTYNALVEDDIDQQEEKARSGQTLFRRRRRQRREFK